MSEIQKMKAFINALLDEYYPECGDIDGASFQDIAEEKGILIPEIRYQPCGESCVCAEVVYSEEWKDGFKCYRAAEWLKEDPSPETPEGEGSEDRLRRAARDLYNLRGAMLRSEIHPDFQAMLSAFEELKKALEEGEPGSR